VTAGAPAPFVIAPAVTPDDLVAAADLFRDYSDFLKVDLGFQDFETELATLPGKYAPPGGVLLLARDAAGSAVGCVALRPLDDAYCEMKRLYVAPPARGTGLGKALMEAIVAEGRRRGYRAIRLDTLPEMTVAQAMYRAAGFESIAPYYETPVDMICLELGLS
jgi:ribosomal protein S18 acetylase RimI-like enzyme